jgi:phenylalanyl-tRNA synthetase alpha chain
MPLSERIEQIKQQFKKDLDKVSSSKEIEELKVFFLGKKGSVQELMKHLKQCDPKERPLIGQSINDLKTEITSQLTAKADHLTKIEREKDFENEKVDITLPGVQRSLGRFHPITQMMNRVLELLSSMGFVIECGPDVDSDYHNFEALNFSEDHPAREMQDTFYLSSQLLLRTHTSNIQVRAFEKYSPPIRIAAPGRCFRNETISARSHVFFHQVEGFYVDKDVTFKDLLATLEQFWTKLFQKEIKVRFRPSYFPFVEPGLEVDIECTTCLGKGCRLCKQTGWLEVAGAGMIHPNVLKAGGIDPDEYSGYAWGMGIERLAMLEYQIKDIRAFSENDIRFLRQFP